MDSRSEPLHAHDSGLIQLQHALNDLEEIAGAFQEWSGDPTVSPLELLTRRQGDETRRMELIEGLAEFLQQRSQESLDSRVSSMSLAPSHAPENEPIRDVSRRFQVLRHHADGGLGTVSVAIDRELNREVAIKQIQPGQADDQARRDRFLVEAEITGGLEHPGIVPVYGMGHSADGRPYYAMRLIRGETLASAIDRFHATSFQQNQGDWGLELRRLLRRFIDVCNAIEYAHGRGILHRDLKPSNVMLGKHGETLVVDWGLAKPIQSAEDENEEEVEEGPLMPSSGGGETQPGSAVGTPSFMSPEQTGRRGPVGPRSDVYSLGATFYCLLTSRAPFVSREPGRIIQDVREGNFPRPRQVNPKIPRELEAIVLKAMALDPDDRYGSARELAEDIERWKADEPISALRDPLAQRLGRWARRRRTTVTAALATVMVATVALGIVLALQSTANRQLRRANETAGRINRELLEASRREATINQELTAASLRERARFDLALDAIRVFHAGVNDELLLREAEFAGLRSRLLRGAIEFYGKLQRDLENHQDRSSREAIARVYSQLADLEATLGSSNEILAAHRKALAIRRKLASESPDDLAARSEVASALISLGLMVRNFESPSKGLEHVEEARKLLTDLTRLRPEDSRFSSLLVQSEQEIGQILFYATDRKSEAVEALDRALRIQRRLTRDEPESEGQKAALATLCNRKGVFLIQLGRPQAAFDCYQESRLILNQLIGADPGHSRYQFELSNVLKDIGDILGRTGSPDQALAVHRQALGIRESLSAALPASVGYRIAISHSLMSIGNLCGMTGRRSDAIDAYRRSVALQKAQQDSPIGLYNLGCTQANLSYCLEGGESEIEADRAAKTMKRAVEVGFRDVAALKSLGSFRPKLNENRTFQLLIRDLDFPANPFANPVTNVNPSVTDR